MRASLVIVVAFWAVATTISMLREQIVRCRPDEYVNEDVCSRVSFSYTNPERVAEIRQAARDAASRVYRVKGGAFDALERRLVSLPEDVGGVVGQGLPKEVAEPMDSGSITLLKEIRRSSLEDYKKGVASYVNQLRGACRELKLVVLPVEEREKELQTPARMAVKVPRGTEAAGELVRMDVGRTYADKPTEPQRAELLGLMNGIAEQYFMSPLSANVAGFTIAALAPTHELDPELTAGEQNDAARHASVESATRKVPEKAVLVSRGGMVTQAAWKLLVEEQKAYVGSLGWGRRVQGYGGMAGVVALISAGLAVYVAMYQPRVVKNHARAVGISGLLAATLVVPVLAAIGTGPLLVFGTGPTILSAMILAIAYDRRFALGIASLHGVMVTAVLGQGIGFFLIMWMGVTTCCVLLDEVRTRSKLVEVGGATAAAMALAAGAIGGMQMDGLGVIWRNCLHGGAAGLGVGFVVLGILPFIEKTFRITTSMTLLELADVSNPLLKRLSLEAPGTYSHSLGVATLAEAAAEAIDANSLLCRVGSYYHDIGKINKSDYFCENQIDGQNRHLNLSPNVSLLIILGHVKDGAEMAKEYNLPGVIVHFIQQHHGTMLVEYFYHQACNQRGEGEVSEEEYRYPGPRPRTRETAVVMIADAVESATRAMVEPHASRIEALVHELIMKRLLDGQFDEADVTFQELSLIEKSLVKTLLSVYHGRLAYPSTVQMTHGVEAGAVKMA
ncbi:MAG: HDIG domain-containing protein [Planctomycetota bacterium]|nr:HDIG domain-containing protein [Planctomycetota bacterium]